ncbi:sodium:solute symporter [bacterium]|nr:sodium:solute symporter [bacterium]
MNLSPLDWTIFGGMLLFLILSIVASRTLMKSVADFLAAGRSAGRYLLAVSSGIAMLGAITIVGNLEMNLLAGFSMTWWGMTTNVVLLIMMVFGWVTYRFRQTRALTIAHFFELRYSRAFRVYAGILAAVSGLINFGIFPSVGTRFFIYFCGLPDAFPLFGLMIPTFPVIMAGLLSISLYFVFAGGQIAVIITDFVQGVFINVVFVAIILYLLTIVDWGSIQQALQGAPENASLINPFKTGHIEDFNFWYFLIGIFGVFYGAMSWQGTQGYNASARNAHEAKMAGMLSAWRGLPQTLMLMIVPIIAYTVLHHANFAGIADSVNAVVGDIEGDAIQSQLKVPLVLSHLLPVGLMGAFAAVMLAAFISTHDSYLHSWGSIIVQDVIMPFRKQPFTPEQHIKVLRWTIIGVAIFIFFFSLLFKQSQYIFLFFAITGAIFAGGSGAVIIGGLYWSRGTTAAAWAAMTIGSGIAVGGIIIHQLVDDFPINGQMFWAISMGAASVLYLVVSLLTSRGRKHNMDKLLHRGEYDDAGEIQHVDIGQKKIWKLLGMTEEFTAGDKLIFVMNYAWTFFWFAAFVVGTVYNLSHEVSDESWMTFWKIYVYVQLAMALVAMVWFTVGGAFDLKKMVHALRTMVRDDSDSGFVSRELDVAATEVPPIAKPSPVTPVRPLVEPPSDEANDAR